MSVNNAYRLCIAVLKQDASGSTYSAIKKDKDRLLKWELTSIIPKEYDFTNFDIGDVQIETVEKPTITDMSKSKDFESGAITPEPITLANMTPADAGSLVATLNSDTTSADPFRVLFLAGIYKEDGTGTREYDVFKAGVCLLTGDGGRSGEAKQTFTGQLSLQACDILINGVTDCNATLSWNTSTGVITATFGT